MTYLPVPAVLLPYDIRWIQRFLLNDEGVRRLAPNDALAAFAQHLEQDGRVQEWQVRQAVRAIDGQSGARYASTMFFRLKPTGSGQVLKLVESYRDDTAEEIDGVQADAVQHAF